MMRLEKDDVNRRENEWPVENQWHQRDTGDGHMNREDKGHGFLKVVKDAPARTNRCYDRGEIIVEDHQGCRFASHIGASFHPWRYRYVPL